MGGPHFPLYHCSHPYRYPHPVTYHLLYLPSLLNSNLVLSRKWHIRSVLLGLKKKSSSCMSLAVLSKILDRALSGRLHDSKKCRADNSSCSHGHCSGSFCGKLSIGVRFQKTRQSACACVKVIFRCSSEYLSGESLIPSSVRQFSRYLFYAFMYHSVFVAHVC
jgi:hypothetical protein